MSLEKKIIRWLFTKPMNQLRGWSGEQKTTLNLWLTLDNDVYRRFNNIIIPTNNGSIQIDHLLVSEFGLFIIETKNITGWIFGSADQARWTQTLYGKKYSFQNPLRQTFRQKKGLSEFLKIHESKIHPIVHFVGECEFKTPMPSNVLTHGLSSYVKQHNAQLFDLNEIHRIEEKLSQHISESTFTIRDHIESLHNRHSSDTICPKCGSKLVERIAHKGRNAGSKFLGCNRYPECKFTRNL